MRSAARDERAPDVASPLSANRPSSQFGVPPRFGATDFFGRPFGLEAPAERGRRASPRREPREKGGRLESRPGGESAKKASPTRFFACPRAVALERLAGSRRLAIFFADRSKSRSERTVIESLWAVSSRSAGKRFVSTSTRNFASVCVTNARRPGGRVPPNQWVSTLFRSELARGEMGFPFCATRFRCAHRDRGSSREPGIPLDQKQCVPPYLD